MNKKNNDIEFMDMDMDLDKDLEPKDEGFSETVNSEGENTDFDTKKKSKIKYVYLAFTLLLLIGMIVFLWYCNNSLRLYESAQPEYVMEDVLGTLSVNGIDALDTSGITFHALEADNDYLTFLDQQLRNASLTYKKLRESYSDGALIYGIYNGDTLVAEATLLPGESYQRMYLLTITDWNLSGITATQPPSENFRFTASLPDNYTITVNGISLDETYLTSTEDVEILNYCKSYVDTPGLISYEVSGLASEPAIVIYDFNGNVAWENEGAKSTANDAATVSGDNELTQDAVTVSGDNSIDIEIGFMNRELTDSEEDQALREMILEGVERYSNFFSKDLPGCRESIDPIRDLFPEDSIYLTLADQYRREDMGVFSSHTNTHFENEEISEFTWYSEDCFSCRVRFDKSMTLGREIIDTTDNVYFYVKLDGAWVIADIQ